VSTDPLASVLHYARVATRASGVAAPWEQVRAERAGGECTGLPMESTATVAATTLGLWLAR